MKEVIHWIREHKKEIAIAGISITGYDRVLQKFYDAVYLDTRDGSEKKGSELSNGRISRNHKKDSENLHQYRGHKMSKGHDSIRRGASSLKPGAS